MELPALLGRNCTYELMTPRYQQGAIEKVSQVARLLAG